MFLLLLLLLLQVQSLPWVRWKYSDLSRAQDWYNKPSWAPLILHLVFIELCYNWVKSIWRWSHINIQDIQRHSSNVIIVSSAQQYYLDIFKMLRQDKWVPVEDILLCHYPHYPLSMINTIYITGLAWPVVKHCVSPSPCCRSIYWVKNEGGAAWQGAGGGGGGGGPRGRRYSCRCDSRRCRCSCPRQTSCHTRQTTSRLGQENTLTRTRISSPRSELHRLQI